MPFNETTFKYLSTQPGVVNLSGTLTNPGTGVVCSNPKIQFSTTGTGEYQMVLPGTGNLEIVSANFNHYSNTPPGLEALRFVNDTRIVSVSGTTLGLKTVYGNSGLHSLNTARYSSDSLASDTTPERVIFAPTTGLGDISINTFWFATDAQINATPTDNVTFTFRRYNADGVFQNTINATTLTFTLLEFERYHMSPSTAGISPSDTITLEITKGGAGAIVPTGIFGMNYFGAPESSISIFETVYFSISFKNSSGA